MSAVCNAWKITSNDVLLVIPYTLYLSVSRLIYCRRTTSTLLANGNSVFSLVRPQRENRLRPLSLAFSYASLYSSIASSRNGIAG